MSDIFRTILVMSISGSVLAVLLFALKPLIRSRLLKTAQYYLWLIIIAALLLPVSRIIVFKDNEALPVPAAPVISGTVSRYIVTQEEELDRVQQIPIPADKDSPEEYTQTKNAAKSPVSTATTLLVVIYPFGILIALPYFVIGYIVFTRSHRRKNRAARAAELAMLTELCGNKRIPRLYRNPHTKTPMLFGVFNPAIILPEREYTDAQLRAVLRHELTHYRRKDVLVKWLSMFACAVHWFNPIVWLVRREIDRACELACDEAVIHALDACDKQNYGETLITIAADSKVPHTILSTTMCERKKSLKQRLTAIMEHKKASRKAGICSIAFMVLLAGCALVLGAGSRSDGYSTSEYPPSESAISDAQLQEQTQDQAETVHPTIETQSETFGITDILDGEDKRVLIYDAEIDEFWDTIVIVPDNYTGEDLYWRIIADEIVEKTDSFIIKYGVDVLFQGLKSTNPYSRYYCINRLVEHYNDAGVRTRAIAEITPFLNDGNETIRQGAEFAISVLTKKFDSPYISHGADGTKFFVLFNYYSYYGSYKELWTIKNDRLSKLYSFPDTTGYVYIMSIELSPDNDKIAVQTSTNRSISFNIIDIESKKISPEIMKLAIEKVATDNKDYNNTYPNGRYCFGDNLKWIDNNTVEFEADLSYDYMVIIERVIVKYNVLDNSLEISERHNDFEVMP